jgi:GNAT superfamily N-acetyltransferase
MSLTIQRAKFVDLNAIVRLLADDVIGVSREDTSVPVSAIYQSAFRSIEEDKNQLLCVAKQDDRVVGCLQLTFIPGLSRKGMWRGQIEGVRIASDARGEGVGQFMVSWAVERCLERGCGLIQLTTDKARQDAHRFYSRLGFVPSHIGMKLDLSGNTSRRELG